MQILPIKLILKRFPDAMISKTALVATQQGTPPLFPLGVYRCGHVLTLYEKKFVSKSHVWSFFFLERSLVSQLDRAR